MSLKDNQLSDKKELILPPVDKQRSEYHAFLQGVTWLLKHLTSYRFAEIEQEGEDAKNNEAAYEAARVYAKRIYPPYDASPPPSRGNIIVRVF